MIMALTIDTHHHMLPDFFFEATNEKESPVGGLKPQIWTPESSLAFMDEAGIDIAILSISTPGVQLPDNLAARELARKCNELAASLISKYPKQFGAFASAPMSDVNEAVDELTYALDVLKLDGVVLFTNSGGIYLGDKTMKPLFDELQRRKAVVYVHPNASPDPVAHRLGLIDNLIDFPGDTTRAIAQLHYGGTFAATPMSNIYFRMPAEQSPTSQEGLQ
jgi:predicted TIM-barrel fold metal-dependent hydrolase